MKQVFDLSTLEWKLAGFFPNLWRFGKPRVDLAELPDEERFTVQVPDLPPVPVQVPGSVQLALREAGLIPDWNVGDNARLCEWIENRHWIFQTTIPSAWFQHGGRFRLRALGLDYSGWVLANHETIGEFKGSLVPHVFNLPVPESRKDVLLQIIFDVPPRHLGQFGETSRFVEWKPRFNYGWDWTLRLVQIGIWDEISIERIQGSEFDEVRFTTDYDPASQKGALTLWGSGTFSTGDAIEVVLSDNGRHLVTRRLLPEEFGKGARLQDLPVQPWFPNGEGDQKLYALSVRLTDASGKEQDARAFCPGFKRTEWVPCKAASKDAEPWLCKINGKPVFLQGVNWTPIRPNFADVRKEDYELRIETYKDLGANLLRVWGGSFLETEVFYVLCDQAGLLIWQEFPLSSSGVDNYPPTDPKAIEELAVIAASYIARRQNHVCLLMWCGGNELYGGKDGNRFGHQPVGTEHPLLARFKTIVDQQDPGRRFVPGSPSGPTATPSLDDLGKGICHDVHGPWALWGTFEEWEAYWRKDDSLFRSETGCPGASPFSVMEAYRGNLLLTPGDARNQLWSRTSLWIEWHVFRKEKGRDPFDIQEYIDWSQERQRQALEFAVRVSKERFPACSGILLWMGHDSFPCMANTSILDIDGKPKPAALSVSRIWRSRPGKRKKRLTEGDEHYEA